MKAEHTKGPWTLGKAFRHAPDTWLQLVFADQSCTMKRPAEAAGMSKNECEANARLIAAAQDLLEACTKAHDAMLALHVCDQDRPFADETRAILKAAIAKATG